MNESTIEKVNTEKKKILINLDLFPLKMIFEWLSKEIERDPILNICVASEKKTYSECIHYLCEIVWMRLLSTGCLQIPDDEVYSFVKEYYTSSSEALINNISKITEKKGMLKTINMNQFYTKKFFDSDPESLSFLENHIIKKYKKEVKKEFSQIKSNSTVLKLDENTKQQNNIEQIKLELE